jgi:membrane-bound metal-dependent hydrolase YbcI (DUF457 family)
MMWRTHVLLGLCSLWLLNPFPHALTSDNLGPLCALAAFGALLPDLDAGESKVKSLKVLGLRPFVPFALAAHRSWGHRGLLHSPLGLLLFAGICLPIGFVWGAVPAVALWLGYASHLTGDACTRTGIPSWPNRATPRLHLLPIRWRLTTGSFAEEALLPFLALPVLLLLLMHFPAG